MTNGLLDLGERHLSKDATTSGVAASLNLHLLGSIDPPNMHFDRLKCGMLD